MARQNTRLEAEGAEFLVLGNLLIRGIATYKTYTNMPGYDLIAVNPSRNVSARIQVKSRWRTNAEGFIIRNFDTDFVVVALLNRGSRDGAAEEKPPAFYVLPVGVVEGLRRAGWGKIGLSAIPDREKYRDAWHLVREFLGPADPAEAEVPTEEDEEA